MFRILGWKIQAAFSKTLVSLLQMMPPERAARVANFTLRRLKPFLPFTKKMRRNLALAFPDKNRREIELLTRDACGNLGCAVADLASAERIWAERNQRIEFVMEDGVDLREYRGRPAVLVTGHIGAWQIAGYIAAEYALRITTVYAPEKNPYLSDWALKLRSTLPCNFISRDGCMRGLMKELKQGSIVGLTSDTRLDGGDMVPFFGIPTPTNTTAARLAIHHKCELFPVRAERLPGMRFRITIYRAIRADNTAASVSEQARKMTQKLFEHFEAWIRETPDQWMCFGRRWPQEAYADAGIDAR